jgi:hypothetical protein
MHVTLEFRLGYQVGSDRIDTVMGKVITGIGDAGFTVETLSRRLGDTIKILVTDDAQFAIEATGQHLVIFIITDKQQGIPSRNPQEYSIDLPLLIPSEIFEASRKVFEGIRKLERNVNNGTSQKVIATSINCG